MTSSMSLVSSGSSAMENGVVDILPPLVAPAGASSNPLTRFVRGMLKSRSHVAQASVSIQTTPERVTGGVSTPPSSTSSPDSADSATPLTTRVIEPFEMEFSPQEVVLPKKCKQQFLDALRKGQEYADRFTSHPAVSISGIVASTAIVAHLIMEEQAGMIIFVATPLGFCCQSLATRTKRAKLPPVAEKLVSAASTLKNHTSLEIITLSGMVRAFPHGATVSYFMVSFLMGLWINDNITKWKDEKNAPQEKEKPLAGIPDSTDATIPLTNQPCRASRITGWKAAVLKVLKFVKTHRIESGLLITGAGMLSYSLPRILEQDVRAYDANMYLSDFGARMIFAVIGAHSEPYLRRKASEIDSNLAIKILSKITFYQGIMVAISSYFYATTLTPSRAFLTRIPFGYAVGANYAQQRRSEVKEGAKPEVSELATTKPKNCLPPVAVKVALAMLNLGVFAGGVYLLAQPREAEGYELGGDGGYIVGSNELYGSFFTSAAVSTILTHFSVNTHSNNEHVEALLSALRFVVVKYQFLISSQLSDINALGGYDMIPSSNQQYNHIWLSDAVMFGFLYGVYRYMMFAKGDPEDYVRHDLALGNVLGLIFPDLKY
jgi:hypothetical protein